MRKLQNHLIGIDQGSKILFSDFEDGGQMWTGKGPRETRVAVLFSEPVKTCPSVQVGLSMFDMDKQTNQRTDLSTDNITQKGFDLVFRTWGDTRMARARADWTAIGEAVGADDWDVE